MLIHYFHVNPILLWFFPLIEAYTPFCLKISTLPLSIIIAFTPHCLNQKNIMQSNLGHKQITSSLETIVNCDPMVVPCSISLFQNLFFFFLINKKQILFFFYQKRAENILKKEHKAPKEYTRGVQKRRRPPLSPIPQPS